MLLCYHKGVLLFDRSNDGDYFNIPLLSITFMTFVEYIKGEPELTDPFNLLINVKLRML